ncbi:hypothetical protein [Pseudomonas sp. TMW22090]|uniref:hypothetical protein n=1 Tax=Pseudomonas sp. TMW22090 TaxID=2506434 RepID=UPI001F0F1245|nr:hypothetical protein [Pseudomonas sp. TMW22090]
MGKNLQQAATKSEVSNETGAQLSQDYLCDLPEQNPEKMEPAVIEQSGFIG